ncbi:hypothetical protein PIB30_058723 [Stylosanthes scabra]|uniref:Uncharacterized protein n=1 Tax=Stylosanthes scabra TaxID=79078 RepID=A0ABU6SLV9_9FABA|nr:hypothetical protein [Stylosanthes scabra]
MRNVDWMVPIEFMVGSLDHGEVQACSICRIPDELRESKRDAYVPKLVSMGPFHRGATRQLVLMEEPKWRYLKDFLQRQGSAEEGVETASLLGERLRRCGSDILNLDTVISACYGGDLELGAHELSKIMMVDGCFLLELLLRLDDYLSLPPKERDMKYSEDPFFATEKKVVSVLNDITMMENQIPFVVLKKLYRKVYRDGSEMKDDNRVANLLLRCTYTSLDAFVNRGTGPSNSKGSKTSMQRAKRCATRLLAAGISISPAARSHSNTGNGNKLVDMFDIIFNREDIVLEIPPLHIKETSQVRWRNLIGWEQSRIWIRCKYTSYALFFGGLICCKHDIEWLQKKGVIINESKMSKEELLRMFQTISKGAEHMDPSYSELCVSLNEHRAKRVTQMFNGFSIISWHQCRRMFEIIMFYWSNWYGVLIRDHIPTVWKFMGVVAAVVLLVLTIMQTYYAAHSNGR